MLTMSLPVPALCGAPRRRLRILSKHLGGVGSRRQPCCSAAVAAAAAVVAPPLPSIQEYLARIGLGAEFGSGGLPSPTEATLTKLHRAHQLSCPFENLDIYPRGPNRPITLNEALILDKVVRQRRGGFCYELNTAFGWLLRALGFHVDRLSARMNTATLGQFGPPFDHMCLRVGGRWLCDVTASFALGPLQLRIGQRQSQRSFGQIFRLRQHIDGGGRARIRRNRPSEAGELMLTKHNWFDGWLDTYIVDLRRRAVSEFGPMCIFHQSSADTLFLTGRFISMAVDDVGKSLRRWLELGHDAFALSPSLPAGTLCTTKSCAGCRMVLCLHSYSCSEFGLASKSHHRLETAQGTLTTLIAPPTNALLPPSSVNESIGCHVDAQ